MKFRIVTEDFVAAHRLELDDYIMVYKDDETGSYVSIFTYNIYTYIEILSQLLH